VISLWKYHKKALFLVVLSTLLYGLFAYELVRSEFYQLLALYTGLFFLAFQLYRNAHFNLKTMLIVGLLFRLIFMIAIPNLSQDFYRFIWDGYLNLAGINPYLYTPIELLASDGFAIPNQQELYAGMGELSASNYSNYPPFNQWLFSLANLFPGNSITSSIVGLRFIIILADVGVVWIGSKLLQHLKLPVHNSFWYFLNPFIIIELTGNLHFEGVMLFFLLLSLYLLSKKELLWSAICMGLSILVKLIPLMLLPLFFSYFILGRSKSSMNWKALKNYKQLIGFYAVTGLVIILSFAPYFSQNLIDTYSSTTALWFNRFEFNASVYYVLRSLGYSITGYNQIAVIGKLLPVITVIFILYRSVFVSNTTLKRLAVSMLFITSLYFFLSTTVHPWYLTTLVVLGLFTTFKYPVVWSLTVGLSYFAYSQENYVENYWVLALEYTVVLWFLFKELRGNRQH